jgi:uncharacterized membrane protein
LGAADAVGDGDMKQEQKDAISLAAEAAKKKTSAHIVTVVAHKSDIMLGHTQLWGLVLGIAVALGCWYYGIVASFPKLLIIELLPVVIISLIPELRHLMLRLLPRRLVHYHAARRAYEEYISLTHNMPATEPVVFFYISMAERYTHILANHIVREKIPYSAWNPVVAAFTASVKKDGLETAATAAIAKMADMLAKPFPG